MERTKKSSAIVALAIIVVTVISLLSNCSGGKYEEEAEKYVNQCVYRDLGIVAECFDSEVIFKDGDERLVAVRYGLDSKDWDGAYCVYMKGEYVANCTTMLPSGYEFDKNLEELKALFGV